MKVFGDNKAGKELKGKYILLDNDFLNQIYRDNEVYVEFVKRFPDSPFLIDSLTKFEFLRDIYNPMQRKLRETFISKPEFFPTTSSNQSIFAKLQINALLLSRIYTLQKQKSTSSFIDLMLAALLMYQSENRVLMTGNKRDFPSCVFDTLTVFNVEQDGDSSMRAYCVVAFNHEKFNKSYEILEKLQSGSLEIIYQEKLPEEINPDVIPF